MLQRDHASWARSPGDRATCQRSSLRSIRPECNVTIAEPERYRLRLVRRAREGGRDPDKTRWECPAQAGKVRCPFCPFSFSALLPEGTPEVEHPPAKAAAPKCGTQRTVTIPGVVTPRLRQTLYWGSRYIWRSEHRYAPSSSSAAYTRAGARSQKRSEQSTSTIRSFSASESEAG